MADIPFLSGEEIIETQDIVSLRNKPFTQVRTKKTGPSGNQNAFHGMFHSSPF
jgi:hypothetical protein